MAHRVLIGSNNVITLEGVTDSVDGTVLTNLNATVTGAVLSATTDPLSPSVALSWEYVASATVPGTWRANVPDTVPFVNGVAYFARATFSRNDNGVKRRELVPLLAVLYDSQP